MALRPGSILNEKYEILTSVLTIDGTNRYFALKTDGQGEFLIVEILIPGSIGALASITSEAESHPYLARIVDHFSTGETGETFVLDVAGGRPLSDRIGRGESLPYTEVIPMLLNLCDALEMLHQLYPPRVRGGVKPENIYVSVEQKLKLVYTGLPNEAQPIEETDPDVEGLVRTGLALLTGQTTIPVEMTQSDGGQYFHNQYPAVPISICMALVNGLNPTVEPRFANLEEFKTALLLALIQIPPETLRQSPLQFSSESIEPAVNDQPDEPQAPAAPVIEPTTPIRRRVPWGFI